MHIVHIQCLLRVDGSTLAGVFLTSSFCVVPESSYSSNEASGSLLVAWYTQTLVAPSQQCMASFQTSALEVATELAVVQLHRPLCVRRHCVCYLCAQKGCLGHGSLWNEQYWVCSARCCVWRVRCVVGGCNFVTVECGRHG